MTSENLLDSIRKDLKSIIHFTAEEHQEITRQTMAIDIQTTANNTKTVLFLDLKKRKPDGAQTHSLGIEILGENIQVHHQKFVATQYFLDDIYKRISRLAKHIETLSYVIEGQTPKRKGETHEHHASCGC